MSQVFQKAIDGTEYSGNQSSSEIAEVCFVRTAEALALTQMASNEQIFIALTNARKSIQSGKPADLIESLARVLGHEEEFIGPAIAKLSEAVAHTLDPKPPSIPFASKLIAPSAFYESFDAIHALGNVLLTPVIYAEDTDAIGVASINPIAARLLADEIYQMVEKRLGIRPFMTTAIMEYESWCFLCRKHFEVS